jgi:Tol biopolymer transport system component
MRGIFLLLILSLFVSIAGAGMLAAGGGLRGLYCSLPDMAGTRVVKYNVGANISWKEDVGVIPEFKAGPFSAIYRGYLLPGFSESYTFTVATSGGVLLIVDNQRLIDDWTPKAGAVRTGTVTLKADKLTPIIIQTTQPAGAGALQLQWSSPSLAIENIPITRMYPPVFAPAQFVYSDNPDIKSSALYLTNLTDTPKKLTVEGSYKPVFSPDGKKVLFQTFKNLSYSNPGIYRYTFSTQEQMKLSKSDGDKCDASYSADGKTIVYVNQAGGAYEIWTMRHDGGGRVKIVSDNNENRHPAINADGSLIIYQSKRDGVWNLYSVSITENGNEEKQLTTLEGTEPALNPTGDKVVFISSRGGHPQLYVMNIDGSEQVILCTTPGEPSQLFFTPNRDTVAYLEKSAAGKTDLHVLDFTDRIPCQLTANGNITSAAAVYGVLQQLPYYTQGGRVTNLIWDDDGTFTTNDVSYYNGPFGATSGGKLPGTVPITGVSALRLSGTGNQQWEPGNLGLDWNSDNTVFKFWYYIPESVTPVRFSMSFTADTQRAKGISLGTGQWTGPVVYDANPQMATMKSTLVIGEWTQVTIKRSDFSGGGYNGWIVRVWPIFVGNGPMYIDGMRFEMLE